MVNNTNSAQNMISNDVIENVVYGSAFGDAWGYVTEFWGYNHILAVKPSPPKLLVISDDTQMSIYTMWATMDIVDNDLFHSAMKELNASRTVSPLVTAKIRTMFADEYIRYNYDPDNNRAPGKTVTNALTAYSKLEPYERQWGDEGARWNNSMGCGTIMRTGWLGLLNLPENALFWLACVASQVTHGHPFAWFTAAIHTINVHRLAYNTGTVMGFDEMIRWVQYGAELFPECDNVTVKSMVRSMYEAKLNMATYFEEGEPVDVCKFLGAGWVAPEALWCALAVYSKYNTTNSTDVFYSGVQNLVFTGGDSDSLAQIGGCYFGATHTGTSLKEQYSSRFEKRYQGELVGIVDMIQDMNHTLATTDNK